MIQIKETAMESDSRQSKSVDNEFERLGENLRKAVEEAWESEERKRISEDLQAGIEEFAETLNRTAKEFVDSPTGQKMRSEVEDFSRRVQEGEVADRVESELLTVLNRLNQKLEEVIANMASERADVDQES
jgi:hypothetical protein